MSGWLAMIVACSQFGASATASPQFLQPPCIVDDQNVIVDPRIFIFEDLTPNKIPVLWQPPDRQGYSSIVLRLAGREQIIAGGAFDTHTLADILRVVYG
jgi:hypothetical protein